MFNQVAIVREIHGLADIDAGRPARNVAGNALAAIEDVEPLHSRLDLDRLDSEFSEARQNAAAMIEILVMALIPWTDIPQMNSGTAQTKADREICRMTLMAQSRRFDCAPMTPGLPH